MATKNEITGDPLVTKSSTDAYRDGWDRIFGRKKKVTPEPVVERDTAKLTDEQREALRQLTDHIPKKKNV